MATSAGFQKLIFRFAITAMLLALITGSVTAAESDIFEESSPKFENIETRLWKDNFLSRQIGMKDDRIHVYAGSFVLFDDNIHLLDDDEKDDAILTTVVGTDIHFGRENFFNFNLAAHWRDNNYVKHDDEDSDEYRIEPEFYFEFNPMFNLTLSARFSKSVSPVDLTTVDRVESHSNGIGFKFQIKPSDIWGVDLKWDITERHYKEGAFKSLEYTENNLSLAPFYLISDKTKLGAEFTYGNTDYEHKIHNEAEWLEGRFSLTYLPSEKWTFYASAGYQDRDYDRSGNRFEEAQFGNLVFTGSILYNYSEQWDFGLTTVRRPLESSVGNFYIYNRLALKAVYTPIAPLKFTAEVFAEHGDESDAADSERYGFAPAVTWSFSEWAGAGASYQYKHKHSDARNGNYNNHVATIGMWLTF